MDKIYKSIYFKPIAVTIVIAYIIGSISIYFFGLYGWTLFVLLPFLLGMLPILIVVEGEEASIKTARQLGLFTLSLFCFSTLLFALEGIMCIFMASPILILFNVLGSFVGLKMAKNRKAKNALYSIVALPAFFLFVDGEVPKEKILQVDSKIVIDAPIDTVWKNVVSFGEIDPPKNWFFKTGVAYPTHATIEGTGVGAIRYCNFTTGSFVEPITHWEAPNLLRFSVAEQPLPLKELNPFWEVHPPHLNGYFESHRGAFKLQTLASGQTEIIGTTWYSIRILPIGYWDVWTKYILHKIHFRVLKHIKSKSENQSKAEELG